MIRPSPEVQAALAAGAPVVALESTIISHGLPRPDNLRIAREIEQVVRDAGAVPATIALVGGEVRIGLDDDALATVAGDDSVVKVGVRDLAVVAARGGHGATTVASTAHLAARAGIHVFATGASAACTAAPRRPMTSRPTWSRSRACPPPSCAQA